MRTSLFATCLTAALAAMTIAEAPAAPDPSALREQMSSQIAAIIGTDGLARTQPMVDDATARVIEAVRTVNRTERTPREILDRSQRFQLVLTGGRGLANVNLRPDQKAAIATYVADVVRSVRPILEDDGRRIDGTFSPSQAAKLDKLEADTLAQVSTMAPEASPLGLDPMAMLADGPALTPGQFVLLTELDYRSILTSSS